MRLQLVLLLLLVVRSTAAISADRPHPIRNPTSAVMLEGNWAPKNHHNIDFDRLPRVPVEHVVVSDVQATGAVNQHNYLLHHDGRFWAMWSDGRVSKIALVKL